MSTGILLLGTKHGIRLRFSGGVMAERVRAGEEEALLAHVARGDIGSFELLYDRYSGPVYSLAWGLLRDAQAAQEVTQDVFLGIWQGARAFDPRRGSARSWIFSLAHHKSVDAVRRQRVRATMPLAESTVDEADVTDEAIRRVERAGVRDALGTLSEGQRVVIALAYYGGYTQREIAERLEMPLGTVKTRMRDGLLRLRTALGADAGERAR